jgi:hypothetical protein
MAALSAADFFKQPTQNRPDRKLLILKKYKDGEAFEMVDNTQVVFKYEKAIYDKIAGLTPERKNEYSTILLKDVKGKTYRLTQIKKNKEFGGGGGSGAGAENTKLNESSVCLWCAVYKEYGAADISAIAKYYRERKVKDSYLVDETDKNMISQSDKLWLDHYERTAEFLVNGMFKQGDWIFHRGSDLVDAINKKFSELNKKMEVPFANINKWSPADIWASRKGFKFDADDCKTLDCFNSYLLNQLKDRKLVGISLKKTVNTIHQENFNVGEKRTPMKFEGYRIKAERGESTILSSKDVYILGKGEDEVTMQVRSFDDLSGYQGELIGKIAKYGKIAHGPINMILGDLKLEKLPDQQIIVTKARAKDEKLIKELYTTFKKYAEPGMTQENFITTVKSTSTKADYLFSKYLGVKLVDIVMSASPKNRDAFVQAAVGYGLSNTKNSAPFIKIS